MLPTTVVASQPPSNLNYELGQGATLTPAFDEFYREPAEATVLYEIEYTPALPDASFIVFNDVTREFTVLGTDKTWAGTYTVKINGMDAIGGHTGISIEFLITVTHPCNTVALTYPPDWPDLGDESTYLIDYPVTQFAYSVSDII